MVLSSELLAGILEGVRPAARAGEGGDYIPALAQVPADRLGSRSVPLKGNCSPQVTFRALLHPEYLQGPEPHAGLDPLSGGDLGPGGQEPSGQPFNSLVQLEVRQGIPPPFINAGAWW